jgi:hypothetical protein
MRSSEEVFRAVSETLGARVSRLPDGETGDRAGWVGFQVPVFAQHPLFELAPSDNQGEAESDLERVARAEGEDYTRPFFGLRAGADSENWSSATSATPAPRWSPTPSSPP